MKPEKPPPALDSNVEITALIEILHRTEHRIEELTAGEVDSVANGEGRTFLLRRAQEALRHSEAAKQAAILNALPANIALLDFQGRIVSVNEAWRHFADANSLQAPGHAVGLNYLDICESAQGDGSFQTRQIAAGIRSVLAGETKRYSIDYPCHSPRQQRWLLLTATPMADGHPLGAVVMHLDVTQRKRDEAALVRFRVAMDSIADGIFLVDRSSMRFIHVNTAACRIHSYAREDYTREELLAINPWEILSTPRAELERTYDAIIASGVDSEPVEMLRSRDDGSPVWLELRRHALRLEDRWTIVSMVRDITGRKKDEQKFKDLLEATPDAMVIANRDGEMLLVNAQAVKLFGWGREELLEQKIDMLVPERFRRTHPENRSNFFAQPQVRPMGAGLDLVGLRKDGSEFPVEISLSPLQTSEGHLVITSIHDITERQQAAQELRESERRFSDMLGNVELISLMLDREARITYCNDYLLVLTGWQYEEVIGRDWFELFMAPEFHHLKDSFFPAILANATGTMHNENEILTRSGERRLIRWNNTVLHSATGDAIGTASIGEDITEHKAAEARVVHLNRVYAVLSSINMLIVRVRDRDELFREACRVAVDQGGFNMAMIVIVDQSSKLIIPVASAGENEALLSAIKDILSSPEDTNATLMARAIREKQAIVSNDTRTDSRVLFSKKFIESGIHSMAALPFIMAEEVTGALVLFANEREFFHTEEMKLLTELAGDIVFAIDHLEKAEKLNYLAYYDVLTGLANRSLFLERVAQYVRSATSGGYQLAVYLIDLERFKNINDSLGRASGDALLRQVAEWLTHNAGDANLLARVGSDHFAMVMPEIKPGGDIVRLLETWMDAFKQHPFHLNDAVFRISAKIGVALYPDDGVDADTLFRNAEAALKKAQVLGVHYLFHTKNMTEAVAARLTLENQLRQALDNEEFVLHYQPKVNLASGKMTSAEALIRWNDPRTGLVPPGHFIPILEETGMIHEVGRWALKQAVADYLRWFAAGLPAVRIAVNVSSLQLRSSRFIDEVKEAIGIDPQAAAGLELEITESLIMENVNNAMTSLQAIRALGVSIAIDDFGTGFSSLSYLAKLPVDSLKIDRSFVIEMTGAPEGLALVSTIIKLAHSLKLKVVAEGVETEEQAHLLRLLDCDEMQGFLFSKPVPSEVFEERFLVPAFTQ